MKDIETLDNLLFYSIMLSGKEANIIGEVAEIYEEKIKQGNTQTNNVDYKELFKKLHDNSAFEMPTNLTDKQKEYCMKLQELTKFNYEWHFHLSNEVSAKTVTNAQALIKVSLVGERNISNQIKDIQQKVKNKELIDYPEELSSLRWEIKKHIEKDPMLKMQFDVLLIDNKKNSGKEWEKDFIKLFDDKTKNKIKILNVENDDHHKLLGDLSRLANEIQIETGWKQKILEFLKPIIKLFSKNMSQKIENNTRGRAVKKLMKEKNQKATERMI